MKPLAILAVLALSGCTVFPPPEPATPTGPSSCTALDMPSYLGRPAAEIAAADGGGPVRIVDEDAPMTLEYLGERLTIVTDYRGRAVRIFCG